MVHVVLVKSQNSVEIDLVSVFPCEEVDPVTWWTPVAGHSWTIVGNVVTVTGKYTDHIACRFPLFLVKLVRATT